MSQTKRGWTSDIVHIKSKLILQKDRISAEDACNCLATLEMKRADLEREFYEEMHDELTAIFENKRVLSQDPSTSSISQFDVSLLTNQEFFLVPHPPEPISSQDSGISETTKKPRGRSRKEKTAKRKNSKVLVLENVQMKNSQQELVYLTTEESNAQSQDLFQSQQKIFDDMEICFDLVPETLTYHETQTCMDLVPATESLDPIIIASNQIGEVVEETQQQDMEEEPDIVGGIRAKLKNMQMTDIQQLGDVIDDVSRELTNIKGVVMGKAHEVLEKRKDKPTVRMRTFKKYNPFYDETTDVVIAEKISEFEGIDFMREEKWKCEMATMEYLRRKQRALLHAPQPRLVDWRTIP